MATKDEKHFYDLAKSFNTGMLVTCSENGLHSRPMRIISIDQQEGFWFITNIDSPKISEISTNQSVAVIMQSSDKWLSVNGTARLVRDKSKIEQLWSETLRPWFPNGKDSPEIVLIEVIPTFGEYWDDSKIKDKLSFAFETTRAYITKDYAKPVNLGETAKVPFTATGTTATTDTGITGQRK